jgi:hypothetical protein
MEALHYGDYERFRRGLLPIAPIPIPDCLIRELEFAERRCRDREKDRLFPIRFLWILEANEQKWSGQPAPTRSRYHPEKLLEFWARVSADPQFRQEREAEGFRFDFVEKAVEMTAGWIYIGERFARDLLEIEAAVGVELLFSGPLAGELRPAFQELKRQQPGGHEPA